MTGHLEEVDYSDSPIYYQQSIPTVTVSDPAPDAEAAPIVTSIEPAIHPPSAPMEVDTAAVPTENVEDFNFDPNLLLPAMYMDDLPFSQTSMTTEALKSLIDRLIILEARVSSYETILNNVVALRPSQNRPTSTSTTVPSVPLVQRISSRPRRAARETLNVETSNGRLVVHAVRCPGLRLVR